VNLLVTGATGFVGRHLIKKLIEQNHSVSLIQRKKNADLIDSSSELKENSRVQTYYYDGSMQSVLEIFNKKPVDLVIHLASHFLASHRTEDVDTLINSNVLFGTQLMQAMVDSGVDKIINVGTVWQNYNNESYNPVCLYAATKEAFSAIAKYYTELHKIKMLTLKLADTYGKDDQRGKIIYILKKAFDNQESIQLTPGEQYLDLVHIDDICEAFLVAVKKIEKKADNNIEEFVISSGKPIKLKELVSTFEKVCQHSTNIVFGGRPYRNRETLVPFNFGKPLPNWSPAIDLEAGIASLYK
jgi:nucleoside-diphosphate-sugar epimerase